MVFTHSTDDGDHCGSGLARECGGSGSENLKSDTSESYTLNPVGAGLARDSGGSVGEDAEGAGAIAGEPELVK